MNEMSDANNCGACNNACLGWPDMLLRCVHRPQLGQRPLWRLHHCVHRARHVRQRTMHPARVQLFGTRNVLRVPSSLHQHHHEHEQLWRMRPRVHGRQGVHQQHLLVSPGNDAVHGQLHRHHAGQQQLWNLRHRLFDVERRNMRQRDVPVHRVRRVSVQLGLYESKR